MPSETAIESERRMAMSVYSLATDAVYENLVSKPAREVSQHKVRLGWQLSMRAADRLQRFAPVTRQERAAWKPKEEELTRIQTAIDALAALPLEQQNYGEHFDSVEKQLAKSFEVRMVGLATCDYLRHWPFELGRGYLQSCGPSHPSWPEGLINLPGQEAIPWREYFSITVEWDRINQRRLDLIESKALGRLSREETTELQELQRLAGIKRHLLICQRAKDLTEIEQDFKSKGLWQGA